MLLREGTVKGNIRGAESKTLAIPQKLKLDACLNGQ